MYLFVWVLTAANHSVHRKMEFELLESQINGSGAIFPQRMKLVTTSLWCNNQLQPVWKYCITITGLEIWNDVITGHGLGCYLAMRAMYTLLLKSMQIFLKGLEDYSQTVADPTTGELRFTLTAFEWWIVVRCKLKCFSEFAAVVWCGLPT